MNTSINFSKWKAWSIILILIISFAQKTKAGDCINQTLWQRYNYILSNEVKEDFLQVVISFRQCPDRQVRIERLNYRSASGSKDEFIYRAARLVLENLDDIFDIKDYSQNTVKVKIFVPRQWHTVKPDSASRLMSIEPAGSIDDSYLEFDSGIEGRQLVYTLTGSNVSIEAPPDSSLIPLSYKDSNSTGRAAFPGSGANNNEGGDPWKKVKINGSNALSDPYQATFFYKRISDTIEFELYKINFENISMATYDIANIYQLAVAKFLWDMGLSEGNGNYRIYAPKFLKVNVNGPFISMFCAPCYSCCINEWVISRVKDRVKQTGKTKHTQIDNFRYTINPEEFYVCNLYIYPPTPAVNIIDKLIESRLFQTNPYVYYKIDQSNNSMDFFFQYKDNGLTELKIFDADDNEIIKLNGEKKNFEQEFSFKTDRLAKGLYKYRAVLNGEHEAKGYFVILK